MSHKKDAQALPVMPDHNRVRMRLEVEDGEQCRCCGYESCDRIYGAGKGYICGACWKAGKR